MIEQTCYMCENQKTSMEHVPPRCLFPEQKDCSGNDFRKNLIKVPSCDLHNSVKSKDDEFMLVTFATNAISNEVGDIHQKTKIMRILERKPHLFVDLLNKSKPAVIRDEEGEVHQTCAFRLDKDRFFNQLRQVANGVYFYHLGTKASGHTEVVPLKGFFTDNSKVNRHNRKTDYHTEPLFTSSPKHGDNPDVFYYQVCGDKVPLIKLVFYGAIEFVAAYNIELECS